jgi:phosphatidylserine/phosphatidylglycerophosphate/cardiolipin synthase-like enzyme
MAEIERKYSAFSIDTVIPLQDRYYYDFLKHAIESAQYRIWASIFIINITREHDYRLEVRDLLKLLSYKRTLGLDVKVIIGESQTPGIREANEIAESFLQAKRVPVKKYQGSKKSTHSKYVILDDDLIVLGSHNWTQNAFSKSEEDSVAIYSKNLNNELNYQFLATWMD